MRHIFMNELKPTRHLRTVFCPTEKNMISYQHVQHFEFQNGLWTFRIYKLISFSSFNPGILLTELRG